MNKLKIHLWTLPRWFAAPFFGASVLLGSVLGGGSLSEPEPWLAFVLVMLIMAGGHSANSWLDYFWTGLDRGEVEDRSAEKSYTGGQNLLASGKVTGKGILFNVAGWYILALALAGYMTFTMNWTILIVTCVGMLITFWYSSAKFNWTHELALGIGVGPFPVLIGMLAVGTVDVVLAFMAGVPVMIVLAFAGLALDEWPDAEANLKKGVKSIAYKVWEYKVDLSSYLAWWIIILYVYQVFMISIEIFAPLTGLTFLLVPFLFGLLVMIKGDFERYSSRFIIVAALYPILLLVGQVAGE